MKPSTMTIMLVALLAAGCWEATSERSGTNPQENSSSESRSSNPANAKTTIPFTLTEFNNISVPALINGTEKVELMFHTAVSDISLTEEATAKMTTLNWSEAANVSSWGGKSSARYSEKNTLQIGNFVFEDIGVTEAKLSGQNTGGKFGPSLFKDQIVGIDFENRELHIYDSIPKLDAGYEKLNVSLNHDSMLVEGEIKTGTATFKNQFLIHTGFSGALLLDDQFVADNKISDQLKTISESELKDSFGNVLKTKKAILPQLKVGSAHFENIPVGFFDGAIGRQKMSVFGSDVLKRFNIIIDLKNSHLYLKPNSLFDSDFAS